MSHLWQLISIHLHTFVGLLDDVGDISSALVITLGTVKAAVACLRRRTQRRVTACSLRAPCRRRRRHRHPHRQPCERAHAAALKAVRHRPEPPAPDRPTVA
jgi:hypothetical protein